MDEAPFGVGRTPLVEGTRSTNRLFKIVRDSLVEKETAKERKGEFRCGSENLFFSSKKIKKERPFSYL